MAGDIASNALLNAFRSFGDPADWVFKSRGCGDLDYCVYMTPSGATNFGDPPRFYVSEFINLTRPIDPYTLLSDRVEHAVVIGFSDFRPFATNMTFASWTLNTFTTDIPEPATCALVLIGFAAAWSSRSGKRAT